MNNKKMQDQKLRDGIHYNNYTLWIIITIIFYS